MPKELILEIYQKYPFGELAEALGQNTSVSVCKKLPFSTQQNHEHIQLIIHFMKAVHHQNLINLTKSLQKEKYMQLYYQYVPIKLEGWLLDINEELMDELQNQFLELAEFLCRSTIKFSFNPECLGVNTDMKLKYFLDQFEIDLQHGQNNFKILKKDFKEFRRELKAQKVINRLKEDKNRGSVKQLKTSILMGSISTNASYSSQEDLTSLNESFLKISIEKDNLKRIKFADFNAKLQANKTKCQQIIQRYKKINCK